MARELALIRWTEKNIVLDPNLDDFGVPVEVVYALRGAPGERRRPIRTGVLECQRCVEINRLSTSVYLRRRGDRLIVAHHKSDAGPCYKPESPEHVALKERVASCAEAHGFGVRMEANTADRKGRADVEVIGPDGQCIGHEVQVSAVNTSVLARRNNTALRDGRIPSWLTTDRSAHSDTRNLIDRVPWAMSNQLPVELIRLGRPLRVSAGLSKLELVRCRDLVGRCPQNPQVFYCAGWHTQWGNVAEAIEDFVGKTASGLYVPVALPTDLKGARRRWITPADREVYRQATGYQLEEEKPAPLPGEPVRGQKSWDSRLHQGEKSEKAKKGMRRRATVTEVVRGDVIVGTLDRLPSEAEPATAGEIPSPRAPQDADPGTGRDAAQQWLDAGLGVSEAVACRRCGSAPTRPYLAGRYCYEHRLEA
ncbi:hypothetical protein Q8791_27270 [Nocardiopsis sp. CT-R113]|uniref:Competence protein CoiA nuclease-like domain-containing protein n=1 Tax=Nocardiopsis codii TaxID=3065942 RepID=A0ABU7KFY9_9ACTN|nr:hypothetical protein [Nocardiopsis sp. CT-R113]MEE2040927.1 hypothetical protein [Nocardiopsis sp. CT-R113]